LTNLEHTVLMYDMMMKQVLENLDPLPEDTRHRGQEDITDSALEHLAEHIHDFLEPPREAILHTLQHAVQRGYLQMTEKKGCCHWEWVDYL
jgi:hypothetical protein